MIHSDEPIAGWYMARLAKGATYVPIRIYFGNPIIDHEEQDRSPRWCIIVNGETDRPETGDGYSYRAPLDIDKYWPWCGRHRITEAEYNYMIDKAAWAVAHAPDRPQANPRKKIDVRGRSVF